MSGGPSAPADMVAHNLSLRHPHVSLRDTIIIKLVVLIDPHSLRPPTVLAEQVGEVVDDLIELIREGL